MSDLDRQFEKWISDNEHILEAFITIGLQAKADGRKRIGAKFAAELVRWNSTLRSEKSQWKVPNSMVSRLAREAMKREPQIAGMFNVAKLRA